MTEQYLKNRLNVLNYTNEDMNLQLNNNNQVYIALIDVPTGSGIIDNEVMSIALVFGLNTHVYYGGGSAAVNLEQNKETMHAMQSILISCEQVTPFVELTEDFSVQDLAYKHIYLKTAQGVHYTKLNQENKYQIFLENMANHMLSNINIEQENFVKNN